MRLLAVAAPLVVGGYYFVGGFDGGYSRVVSRPIDEVAWALSDLDISDQPGEVGTDPSRSGGVRPIITHQRTAEGIVWTVRSGNDVAITMTAKLTPIEDGKKTKVTTSVARGNAPDDFVSPAFRSTGIAQGLFSMAVEDELNELVAPPPADPAVCEKLRDQFQESGFASEDLQRQDGLGDAIGDVAKAAQKLQAYEAEARRLGCMRAKSSNEFSPVTQQMKAR